MPHNTYLFQLLRGILEPEARANEVPDFASGVPNRRGELYQAVVDRAWLEAGGEKPVWPDGKPFAVCLSHDVDSISQLDPGQNIRSMFRLWRTRGERRLSNTLKTLVEHKINALRGIVSVDEDLCHFDRWTEVESRYLARSTFFFPPQQVGATHGTDCPFLYSQIVKFRGGRIPVSELIQILDREGWEIGLHPSWHSHADAAEMAFQKEQLESVLGHPIQSVRQHFLKHDPLRTPATQNAAGFSYDSTLGYNDNIGFRRGTSYPYALYDRESGKTLTLMEIPLLIQDGAMLLPQKGLRMDSPSALEYIAMLLEEVKLVGGVLSLSWHPHTIGLKGFWESYTAALELVAREDPWFATVSQIGEWWRKESSIDLLEFTAGYEKQAQDLKRSAPDT